MGGKIIGKDENSGRGDQSGEIGDPARQRQYSADALAVCFTKLGDVFSRGQSQSDTRKNAERSDGILNHSEFAELRFTEQAGGENRGNQREAFSSDRA